MRSGELVFPGGPDSEGVVLNQSECRSLLKTLGGSIIQWTDGFQTENKHGEWYSVICRRFMPLNVLPAKRRSEINRGLRNCKVTQITVEELADAGYRVLCQACKGYAGKVNVPSEEVFKKNVLREAPFQDLVHNWGVYAQGMLIAFAQNQIYGTVEANYSSIKLDPAHLGLYPAYALIHTMNEYYLDRNGFQYVNDGSRSVYHETNIQDFLMRKFGFEKAYATLHVYYSWPLRWLVSLAYPFHAHLGHLNRRLKALLELERCRRASNPSANDKQ